MRRAGFTLVATLVTIALILFLAVYFMMGGDRGGKSLRPDGAGKTYVGAALARGKDTVCIEHLRNNRMALEVAAASSDERPASVDELKIPADFMHCPMGNKEPYVFNLAAADPKEAIKCVHPGHEKY